MVFSYPQNTALVLWKNNQRIRSWWNS